MPSSCCIKWRRCRSHQLQPRPTTRRRRLVLRQTVRDRKRDIRAPNRASRGFAQCAIKPSPCSKHEPRMLKANMCTEHARLSLAWHPPPQKHPMPWESECQPGGKTCSPRRLRGPLLVCTFRALIFKISLTGCAEAAPEHWEAPRTRPFLPLLCCQHVAAKPVNLDSGN